MMMDVRPIRTEADLDWSLKEIEQYFNAPPEPGSPEEERFDVLSTLIEAYENKAYPIEQADPIDVLNFYMEQNGLTQTDLAQVIGSRSRASEILSGRRGLTLQMIDAIRSAWGISADLLVARQRAA